VKAHPKDVEDAPEPVIGRLNYVSRASQTRGIVAATGVKVWNSELLPISADAVVPHKTTG
jgi:hypothetical protein